MTQALAIRPTTPAAKGRLAAIGKEIQFKLGKADKYVVSVNSLLAEAKAICDELKIDSDPRFSFEAFKQQWCPTLGKSQAYKQLAIASGKTTEEAEREKETTRKQRQRAARPGNNSGTETAADTKAKTDTKADDADSAAERKAHYAATEGQPKRLVIYGDDDRMVAAPEFAAKIRPILQGTIKPDKAQAQIALHEFERTCWHLLPQMTAETMLEAENILCAVGDLRDDVREEARDAKQAIATAKRIKWEAKNPEGAKEKALDKAQAYAMEDELEDAKEENRGSGEPWGDQKEQWIDDWIKYNWDDKEQAEFEKEFAEQWLREHGAAFPEHKSASS
jgi:hypothetical protein